MGIRIFLVIAALVAIVIIFILMIAYEIHKFEQLPEKEVTCMILAKTTSVNYFDLPFTETQYFLTISYDKVEDTIECSQETYYKVEKGQGYTLVIKGDRIMGFKD